MGVFFIKFFLSELPSGVQFIINEDFPIIFVFNFFIRIKFFLLNSFFDFDEIKINDFDLKVLLKKL